MATAFALAAARAEQLPQAAAPPAQALDKPAADRLLRSKGLHPDPDAPVYVLEREEHVRKLRVHLQEIAANIELAVTRRNLEAEKAGPLRTRIAELELLEKRLLANNNALSAAGVRARAPRPGDGGGGGGGGGGGALLDISGIQGKPATTTNSGVLAPYVPPNAPTFSGRPSQPDQGNVNRETPSERATRERNEQRRESESEKGKPQPKSEECGPAEEVPDAESCGPNDARIAAAEDEIVGHLWSLMRIQVNYNALGQLALTRLSEFRRNRAALAEMVSALRKRYAELGQDPEVTRALIALNHDSNLRIVLGPLEDYEANLQKLAGDVLKAKGFLTTNEGDFILGEDQDTNSLAGAAREFHDGLGRALARQLERQHEVNAKRIELRKATDKTREKAAQFLASHQQELVWATLEVASDRQAFVQCVDNLGKAIVKSKQKRGEIGNEVDVKEAIRVLIGVKPAAKGKAKGKKVQTPNLDPIERLFVTCSALIKTEPIVMEADRTAPRVSATINSVAGVRLVVEPSEPMVRVSERLASKLKLTPDASEPPVKAMMPDGQELSARSANIKSIAIGPFNVTNVPCLILLDNYDGPAVLGASFLDRFLYQIDADAGKLTLTKVDVPPASKSK
jgi:hypothetical protein